MTPERNLVPVSTPLLTAFSSVQFSRSVVSDSLLLSRFSRVQRFATPWTVAHQAPLSMRFSRQEYLSGWPFLSPRDRPNPGIEPGSPALAEGDDGG